MKKDKFHIKTADEHVSLELLRQYQANLLLPAEEHRVEKHVLTCEMCSDILEGMHLSPELVTQQATQEINTRLENSLTKKKTKVNPFYTWQNWRIAAAVLALILSGVLVFYYNLTKVKKAEVAKVNVKPAAAEPATEIAVIKPASPTNSDLVPATPPIIVRQPGPLLARVNKARRTGANSVINSNEIQTSEVQHNLSVDTIPVIASAPNELVPGTQNTERKPQADSVTKALTGKLAGLSITGNTRLAFKTEAINTGKEIAGRVLSSAGEPLPGVSIVIKGTAYGTSTNAQGQYTLPLPTAKEGITLVYSYVGYNTLEKKVQSMMLANVDVKMEEDAKSLNEVVVVGYGTQSKTDVKASVSYARPTIGKAAYRKYVKENLRYPTEARQQKLQGRVVVGFTVSNDGILSDFKIIKGLSPACNAEAIRLIQEGPNWKPTEKNGEIVQEQVRLAIRFKLPAN